MVRLNEEARWLGQEVGRLRDLDVVANDIVRREAGAHPDEPGLSALADALARQAGEQREHLRELLAAARAQAFLIDLARFVETRGWLVPRILARPSAWRRRSPSWPARRSTSAGRRSASARGT